MRGGPPVNDWSTEDEQCPLPAPIEPESARREDSAHHSYPRRPPIHTGRHEEACQPGHQSWGKCDFRLKRGQLVELVVDDMDSVRCEVIWIGRAGSQQVGEAGLHTVGH